MIDKDIILNWDNKKKKEYNEEKVYYCKECLSLKITGIPNTDICFCENCSSTEIDSTCIEIWENLYKAKYGHKFIENERE